MLSSEDCGKICSAIRAFSPAVRFVGVLGERGELLAYSRRKDLEPLLDSKSTHYQFSHIAIRTGLDAFFDKSLGKVRFVWEERDGVQIIYFTIGSLHIWMSIDKMVVRSEVLRIIDSCLPLVKEYSLKL